MPTMSVACSASYSARYTAPIVLPSLRTGIAAQLEKAVISNLE